MARKLISSTRKGNPIHAHPRGNLSQSVERWAAERLEKCAGPKLSVAGQEPSDGLKDASDYPGGILRP